MYGENGVNGSRFDDVYMARMVDDATQYQQYEGQVLQFNGGNLYFVCAGQKKLIPDTATLTALGLGSLPIQMFRLEIGIPDGTPYPELQPGKTIRNAVNNRVYFLENGVRRWIPDESTFTKMGLSWDNVVVVDFNSLNQIPEGLPMPAL